MHGAELVFRDGAVLLEPKGDQAHQARPTEATQAVDGVESMTFSKTAMM